MISQGSPVYFRDLCLRLQSAPTRFKMSLWRRKIFWISFTVFGLAADFVLPIWWALVATIPIAYASWWIAYRSDWF